MRILNCGLAALALVAAPLAAQAQDLPAAQTFVAHLYAAYNSGRLGYPDYAGRQASAVFAPALLRLIRRDAAETPEGYVGALDGDPICDCQDPGGLHNLTVRMSGDGIGRAHAVARFQFETEWRTVKLDLVAVRGRWRISDVHVADMPSLVAFLEHNRPWKKHARRP